MQMLSTVQRTSQGDCLVEDAERMMSKLEMSNLETSKEYLL
jgi:hypothetical protein